MPEALNIFNSQLGATLTLSGATDEAYASQLGATTVTATSTPNIYASQLGATLTLSGPTDEVYVSELGATVITAGRVEDPKIRAWTFSLDGHDFYVLRLGDEVTFIYDAYSEQWMEWASPEYGFWRPNTGMNWIGGQVFADEFGSNAVLGDDLYGLLWFLDPEQPFDQSPVEYDLEQQTYFERITMGQMAVTGRQVMPCFAAWITSDAGQPAYLDAGVRLETSDDGGKTFDNQGTVPVRTDVNSPELSWYSLGQIQAPGRLFKIIDDGAITRIDSLEMNDPDDD
jgi:hypothetical protein